MPSPEGPPALFSVYRCFHESLLRAYVLAASIQPKHCPNLDLKHLEADDAGRGMPGEVWSDIGQVGTTGVIHARQTAYTLPLPSEFGLTCNVKGDAVEMHHNSSGSNSLTGPDGQHVAGYDPKLAARLAAEAADLVRALGFMATHVVLIGGLVPGLLVPVLDPGIEPHAP